tara:strand:+ start:231 stop:665 length:435 start_codon:yes stop_codon:yes gene_type:complete
MKKVIILIFSGLITSGCYQQSLSMMAPAAGASQGRVFQSSLSTVANYTIQQKTGKSTLEHVFLKERKKVIKKAELVEKTVIEQSAFVKSKIIKQKDKLKESKEIAKNNLSNLKWVLHLKEFKMVTPTEAFPANKQRYSYKSKQK